MRNDQDYHNNMTAKGDAIIAQKIDQTKLITFH